MKKEELKAIAEGFLSGYDKKIMSPQHPIADFVELLVSFGENLTLIPTGIISTPKGVGPNFAEEWNKVCMDKHELLVKANEYIRLAHVVGLVHAAEGGVISLDDLLVDFLKFMDRIPKPKEVKPDMHLLFGKEVCETMAEDGIDEACNLINDGAEYAIMKTDGSNLSAILSQLEEYGGYAFITEDEYNKMMEI